MKFHISTHRACAGVAIRVEGSPGTGSKPEAIYFSGLGYEELVVSGVGDSLDGVEDQRFSDTDRTAQRQTPFGTNVTC